MAGSAEVSEPVDRASTSAVPLPVLEAPGFGLRAAEQRRAALWRQAVGDITTPHYAALVAVMIEPGLDHIGVADRIAADKGTMTEVTRSLLARDLVAVDSDPRDGRRRVLSLRAAGCGRGRAHRSTGDGGRRTPPRTARRSGKRKRW